MLEPTVEITDEEIDALLSEVSEECTEEPGVSAKKSTERDALKPAAQAQQVVAATANAATDEAAEAAPAGAAAKAEAAPSVNDSSSKKTVDQPIGVTMSDAKKSLNSDAAMAATISEKPGTGIEKKNLKAAEVKKKGPGSKKTQKSAAAAAAKTAEVKEKVIEAEKGKDGEMVHSDQDNLIGSGVVNKSVSKEVKTETDKSGAAGTLKDQPVKLDETGLEKSDSNVHKSTSQSAPPKSIPSQSTPPKSIPSRANPFTSSSSESKSSSSTPLSSVQQVDGDSADLALAAADRILEKSRKNSEVKPHVASGEKNTEAAVLEVGKRKDGKVLTSSSVKEKSSDVEPRPVENPSSPKQDQSSWGWNSLSAWGSSVISTATALTSQVGDSVVQVLEAVESSLVEPVQVVSSDNDLTSAARDSVKKKKKKKSLTEEPIDSDAVPDNVTPPILSNVGGVTAEVGSVKQLIDRSSGPITDQPPTGDVSDKQVGVVVEGAAALEEKEESGSSTSDVEQAGWFNTWHITQLTGAVQKQGKSVVGRGLHALETLSRKTIGALIQSLDEDSDDLAESRVGRKKMSALMKQFDECLGVVHFEALRSLSHMSDDKLTNQLLLLSAENLDTLKADLALVSQAFDLGDINWDQDFEEAEQDFPTLVKEFISQLSLNVKTTRLLTFHEASLKWSESCRREEAEGRSFPPQEVHQMGISMLAEFTANGVAVYHKIAQLILIDTCTPVISYKLRALRLAGYTKVLCTEIWIQTRKFTEHIHKAHERDPSKILEKLVGNLYVEASNCCTCLQDSFLLLLPIMHLTLTRVHPLCIDNSGIAHLEGLQVIASMSKMTVEGAMRRMEEETRQRVEETFREVEAVFDLSNLVPTDDDKSRSEEMEVLTELLADYISVDSVKQASEKLTTTKAEIGKWLSACETERSTEKQISANDVHQKCVESMAEFTSCSIEIYHSITQSLLSESSPSHSTSQPTLPNQHASNLTSLTRLFCKEIGNESTLFTHCITKSTPLTSSDVSSSDGAAVVKGSEGVTRESVTPLITNIYLEASNSTTCIQDGYQLLLPILKLYIIKRNCSGTAAAKLCD